MEAGKRRRRTLEERAEVVARYVESGLTQRVFAREEGIGVSTLQLWLRAVSAGEAEIRPEAGLRRPGDAKAEPLALLEVELAGGSQRSGRGRSRYEVELPCGMRLHLGADFAESEVRRLLALMQEVD